MDDFHLVGWLVLRRGEEVLVARRHGVSYAAGQWGLPGGHVGVGEALAHGAAREAREEVGVHVDPADLVPIGMSRYLDDGAHGLDVFFTTDRFTGEPGPVSECDAVAWCRPDELPAPPLPWLADALRRHLVEGAWYADLV